VHRLVLVAQLKPGAHEAAAQLAASTLQQRSDAAGGAVVSIFLSAHEVVFLLEADDADGWAREWFDDPVRSGPLGSWLTVFAAPLHRVPEVLGE
jgi:hypothetical protein